MKVLNAIIIGFTLSVASQAAVPTSQSKHPTSRPSKKRVQKPKPDVGQDFYCPSKALRGVFCSNQLIGCTPLMRASEGGRIEEVRALLASWVDVNARAGAGHTALMLAANEGHLEIVQVLLGAGADPNAFGASFHYGGFMAWMAALNHCNKNWLQIFEAMLQAGVELNPKKASGYSPLSYAISKQKDAAMVEALVKRGADVNIRDSKGGETLLMEAVRYSSADVVKALIVAGADVNARNDEGKTALTIAEGRGESEGAREMVLMLKRAGAKR